MKIKREILGYTIEIELTEDEIEEAHYEQVRKFDLEDCENVFKEVYRNESWLNRILEREEVIRPILEQMRIFYRRDMDKYDVPWFEAACHAARHRTVVEMIEKFKKGD